MDSKLWSDDEVRTKAEKWEVLMVGHANMPAADYIEAAMIEVRDSLLARIAELEAANAELQRREEWEPVPDDIYGKYDTLTVANNGEMLWIDSAYGDGSQRHHAMIPLPDDIRLCRLVDDGPPVVTMLPGIIDAMKTAIRMVEGKSTTAMDRAIAHTIFSEILNKTKGATGGTATR